MTHVTTTSLAAQDFFSTTLTADVAVSDTVINLAAVPSNAEGYLVIDPDNTSTREIIYFSAKGASTVTCPDATSGSGRGVGGTTVQTHTSGTTVRMDMTAEYFSELQNGNANKGMSDRLNETVTNFVASGCVWSGDSYGSTKAASMTSGVVYLAGKRLTVAAVTARTFTASKDTYVDFSDNGDGTALLTYTEVTNNAASPALTAGSLRNAIIVTGASSIANSGSVNQGQETSVLPIASSVAYSVTDSLGNRICLRDPVSRLLGYRQITSNATTTSTSAAQVTGLSCPVIIPANRKVKITSYCPALNNSGSNSTAITIWDGTVGSGTQLQQGTADGLSTTYMFGPVEAVTTPSATSKTYNTGMHVGAGTGTLSCGSTSPAYIKVELV